MGIPERQEWQEPARTGRNGPQPPSTAGVTERAGKCVFTLFPHDTVIEVRTIYTCRSNDSARCCKIQSKQQKYP